MASTDATPTAAAGAGAGAGAGGEVRFAIVSTARIGLKVCPSIQAAPNATVTVVASRSIERAEEWAKAQGVGAWCTYDEVLARDDVDAVYVPIPTGLRHDFLLRAAKAGKHIYSEKPVSGTYEEFKALTEACAAAGVQFMDGTMWVHSKRTREMEARLAAGAIGRVMRVNSAFTFRYPNEEWRNGGDCRTDKTREPLGSFADQGWCVVRVVCGGWVWSLAQRAAWYLVAQEPTRMSHTIRVFLRPAKPRQVSHHRHPVGVQLRAADPRVDDPHGDQHRRHAGDRRRYSVVLWQPHGELRHWVRDGPPLVVRGGRGDRSDPGR